MSILPKPRVTDDSPRLFASDTLEMLSRTHPVVVVIIYLPIIVALVWYGVTKVSLGSWSVTGLFLLGMIAWTFTEYWLHRAIFHWEPQTSWGPRVHFWVHGIHHEWPNDPYRLVMPPAVSIVLFFLFLGLFYFLMGSYSWIFQAGFTFGYLMYDMAHYVYHHRKFSSATLRHWQRHHLLHHFNPRYEDLNFSISVPIWDRVFRTDRPERSRNDSLAHPD